MLIITIVAIVVVIAVLIALNLFSKRTAKLTSDEVASIIERFVDGKSSPTEWDEFVSDPIQDRELDNVRKRCQSISKEFPPVQKGFYCNEKGIEVLRDYSRRLRKQ